MMRIILDCDGVLADWTGHILSILDCGVTIDDCTEFSLRNVLRNLRGREIARKADAIASRPDFTSRQPMLPWATELLDLCMGLGDVMVLTSPWAADGWYDGRVKWLRGMGLHQDNMMAGRLKAWVGADLFVDDKPQNVIDWATDPRRLPTDRAVLLAWPYNERHPALPPNARRMTAQELMDELREGFPPWRKLDE